MKAILIKMDGMRGMRVGLGAENTPGSGVTVFGAFTPRYASLVLAEDNDVVLGRATEIGDTHVRPAGWTREQFQSAIEAELAK